MAHTTGFLPGLVLTTKLAIRSISQALHKFIRHQTATRFSLVFSFLLSAAALTISRHFFARFSYSKRARALGCGAVRWYPHKDPILGLDFHRESMKALREHRMQQLHQARLSQYGHTYAHHQFGVTFYNTDEPENIKAMLATSFENFSIAGPRLHAVLPVLGPKSVFSSNGQDWRDARYLLRPSFVREQVADMTCFDRHIKNLLAKMPKDGQTTVDLQHLFQCMTMDATTDFLLGSPVNMLTQPTPEADQFVRDFATAARISGSRAQLGNRIPLFLPRAELEGAVSRVRDYVRRYLREAIAGKDTGKEEAERSYIFLHELAKTGPHEEYMVDQILSILIAGRDTTAAAMSAVFWYLAREPGAVQKLRAEIRALGSKVHDPTWEQLRDMKYLGNVIKEALRLFPPVATNSRTANRETVLPRGGGPDGQSPILVPKGTPVRYSTYSMHRREDIYGPDAECFRPERWELPDLRVPWEYLPFSGGPRICLGQQFALTQVSLTVFRFFQDFRAVEPINDEPMKILTSITTSLANGCNVVVTPA